MIEAILWDNDGVLVDTEGLFFDATRDALARAGIELTRSAFRNYVLREGRSVFEMVERRGWTPGQTAALRRERDNAYADLLRAGPRAMPEVAGVLRALRGTFRMAVVTTALREHFEIAHQRSGLREYFEAVVAREDYVNSKPAPEPYLTGLARLRLRAQACVAVEDSERGLAAARAAGLRCIIVPNELTRGGRFAGAEAVLESVAEVPAAIDRLAGGQP
jgi:HAD superfamily hydrolase (TIGR01509 family)